MCARSEAGGALPLPTTSLAISPIRRASIGTLAFLAAIAIAIATSLDENMHARYTGVPRHLAYM